MKSTDQKTNTVVVTGVITAITASLCCITPVLALIAGTSGIAASFSWIEPLRPWLIAITLGVLAFAWYLKLKPAQPVGKGADDCDCEVSSGRKSFIQTKAFLGLVTLFTIMMLAFPYYAHIFYPVKDTAEISNMMPPPMTKQINFNIRGMTCDGCASHIEQVLKQEDGVLEVTASYDKGEAIIKYDPSKVDVEKLSKSIDETGYKVVDKKDAGS